MAEPPRRELILEVADRLFRHYGPQKTTIADVAREANVGVGSVYLDFPSKDALLEELSRRRYRVVLQSMRTVLDEASAACCADRLVRVLEARGTGFLNMLGGGVHACDLLHCASDAVKAAQTAYHEQERAILAEVLREGGKSGEFDIPDVEGTLRVLLLAYASFAPPLVFKLDQKQFGVEIGAMHALVLKGLLHRSAPRPQGTSSNAGSKKKPR